MALKDIHTEAFRTYKRWEASPVLRKGPKEAPLYVKGINRPWRQRGKRRPDL